MKLTTLFAAAGLILVSAQPLNAEFISAKEKKIGLGVLVAAGLAGAGLYAKYVATTKDAAVKKEKAKLVGLTVAKGTLGLIGAWQSYEAVLSAKTRFDALRGIGETPDAKRQKRYQDHGLKMTSYIDVARLALCPLALTFQCLKSARDSFRALATPEA